MKIGISTVLCIIISGCLAVGAAMSGCTHSSENNSSTVASPVIQVGKSPFHFDSKHVVALSLVKADPQSGDHWSARVERVQEYSKSFYDSDPWQIQSFSGGDILDRAANRTWILHFIDTLTTYRPDTKLDISNITPAVRSNYGLNPPRTKSSGRSSIWKLRSWIRTNSRLAILPLKAKRPIRRPKQMENPFQSFLPLLTFMNPTEHPCRCSTF